MLLILLGYSHARIGNRQDDIVAFVEIIISINWFVDVSVLSSDRDLAAFWHGLGGVGYQIHEGL